MLRCPGADGEDGISAEHAGPPEQAPPLPIRQTELRLVEGVLPVDPPREAVADERRIDGGVELVVLGVVVGDQRRHEARAVAVAQLDRARDERGVGGGEVVAVEEQYRP